MASGMAKVVSPTPMVPHTRATGTMTGAMDMASISTLMAHGTRAIGRWETGKAKV